VKQERLRILGALVLTAVFRLRGDSGGRASEARPGKLAGVVRDAAVRADGRERGVGFRSVGVATPAAS